MGFLTGHLMHNPVLKALVSDGWTSPTSEFCTFSPDRPALIDRLHDLFRPPNRVSNCRDGGRDSLAAIECSTTSNVGTGPFHLSFRGWQGLSLIGPFRPDPFQQHRRRLAARHTWSIHSTW
jgi:hypothetical protein